MEPGRLRHVVRIERPVEVLDGGGGLSTTWETWADNVRASIEPMRARELLAAAQVQSDLDTVIRMRFRSGVTAKMRVVHTTEVAGSPQIVHVYEIVGEPVHVMERRRELQLMCKRRAAEGFRSDGF